MKSKDAKKVWVGFSDGEPHIYDCEYDGDGCIAVYATQREAKMKYEDVRRAWITFTEPKRPARSRKPSSGSQS